MALTFKDLQDEVKRRATVDQSGTQFDMAIKNIVNTSYLRISREALWRVLRRTASFDTITSYTTGSGGGTFTNDSKSVTISGATFVTDNIKVGRRITLQGSNRTYTISTITGETTLTLNEVYDGTTISGTGTYTILPQEEYNLPIQASHKVFLWHEEYGSPYMMNYIPEQTYFQSGVQNDTTNTPTHYRMWGEDMVIEQPTEASAIRIASSATGDTNINVTVFGTVGGYPDFETITTNASDGTTAVSGSKSFTSIERVVKESSSTGRITVDSNSANVTIAVLPVGDSTAGIMYRKVQLHPLPDRVFPMNVRYYKTPYRLVNDGDVTELGQEFDEAIILLATSKIKFEQNQKEGGAFYNLYKDEERTLKRTNADKIDWFPKLMRSSNTRNDPFIHRHLRQSQFGSNF